MPDPAAREGPPTAADADPSVREGRVVESTGSWTLVRFDGGDAVRARIRGRLRLDAGPATNPVAVGDFVRVVVAADGTGAIEEVLPRRNALRRRAAGRRVGAEAVLAANVDRAWIVQSADRPRLNARLVDRFLVACGREDLPAGVVVNKRDLAAADPALAAEVDAFAARYTAIGYPVVQTSTTTGEGLGAWRGALSEKLSVVAGASGVGKSSLLNAVAPGLALKTGAVSDRTQKGKHTTTFATLHELPGGGYVVDTPGIREFGVLDVEPEDLGFFFPEFRPFIGDCRFQPCTHDHEPDCAVMAALDDGKITEDRYDSYLAILDSLRLGDRGR